MQSIWPFRPRPVGDEAFASWFSRLAWANGLSAGELYRVALPGGRMHRVDLDRFSCVDLLTRLSLHTGIPFEDLLERTLRQWTGRLFEEDDGKNKLPWLPLAGTQQESKSFGQQACVECLRQKPVPFLRAEHRLSFVTGCTRHNVLLVDRCPNCTSPIQPLYAVSGSKSVCMCWHCGFDFREIEPEPTVSFIDQDMLIGCADGDWPKLGRFGHVHPILYFRLLWIVYRLLATGHYAYPLRDWVNKNLLSDGVPVAAVPRIKEVERLPTSSRRILLRYTLALMEEWPSRFVEACQSSGIHSRVILKDHAETPFALWSVVTEKLNDADTPVSRMEAATAKAFLERSGVAPTRHALQEVLGRKSKIADSMAVPASDHRAYGTQRYWKLDGVSTDVRAAARSAAAKDGHNFGPWVDQILKAELKKRGLL